MTDVVNGQLSDNNDDYGDYVVDDDNGDDGYENYDDDDG